jgi:hypothetical protein
MKALPMVTLYAQDMTLAVRDSGGHADRHGVELLKACARRVWPLLVHRGGCANARPCNCERQHASLWPICSARPPFYICGGWRDAGVRSVGGVAFARATVERNRYDAADDPEAGAEAGGFLRVESVIGSHKEAQRGTCRVQDSPLAWRAFALTVLLCLPARQGLLLVSIT